MRYRKVVRMLLAAGCFYVIAVANDRLALHVLCWTTVSLTLISLSLARLATTGLAVRRLAAPTRLQAGDPLPLRLELANRGSFTKRGLLLVETVDNETQGQTTARTVLVSLLPGEGRLPIEVPGQPAQRGRVLLGPVKVRAGDPLGLYERVVVVDRARHELLVRPRVVALPWLTPAAGAAEGGQRRARVPDGMELRAVREYQQGDDLRRVDWRTTAHTGRLHIREHDDPGAARGLVVVDLHGPPPEATESLVCAAASAAARLVEMGLEVAVVGHEGVLREAEVPAGGDAGPLLDLLAEVLGTGEVSAAALLGSLAQRLNRAAVVVVVTAAEEEEDLTAELRRWSRHGKDVWRVAARADAWEALRVGSAGGVQAVEPPDGVVACSG
ncbi:MAG: DUF58 domain-containing protein [Armatimonadetes bacterium]|nr:DUF58 domain-containing protein [Armatimonadota bacterium]